MPMEELFILGAGGMAKEAYYFIQTLGRYHIRGFVDVKRGPAIRMGDQAIEVFGEADLVPFAGQASLAIGVGNPPVIRKLAEKFSAHFNFPNLIHKSVIGNFSDIQWGKGNLVLANCVFTTSIKVGSFNIFNLNCMVSHDVQIGDYNVINPSVNISGGVVIGDTNLIGVKSTILQYKAIGNMTTIGASSLVTKDVKDGITVMGIPAKRYIKQEGTNE